MCGIFGEWSLELGALTTQVVLEQMTALMQRRGPDDSGTWTDGKRCQLGFRRLSILDLSQNSHQPIATLDNKFILVFNGEVYNFREIRSQLESKGIQFQSSGDSEVVLYALREWGKSALDKFNGMFALAFYDCQKQKILLARDHAGIKPLYYAWTQKGLVFGSQYNQILRHPWMQDAKVSYEGFSQYLKFGSIPAPYGLLEESHMLPLGGWVEVDLQHGLKEGKYFEFSVYRQPDLFGNEANEAVDHAITNAVKRCLISDVPLGCFLSGGIDSPLVAAKAKEIVGSMPVFTIGTAGDRHDESQDAKKYAEEMGHQFFLEQLPSTRAIELLEDVVAACSEPFADFSMFPSMLVSRLAAQNVKVVLSGDGPDELFWGYVERYLSVIQSAKRFQKPAIIRKLRYIARLIFKRHEPSFYWSHVGEWYENRVTRLRKPWVNRIFPELENNETRNPYFNFSNGQEESTAQWVRWNEYHIGMQTILQKVDRSSMYNSLEVRVPLLDREVVEVASRVDWKTCIDRKAILGKLPLRKSLTKRTRFQTYTKRGFTVGMDDWFRNHFADLYRELVLSRDNFMGIEFQADQAELMLNEHLKGITSYHKPLWLLLSLALWENTHYIPRQERTHSQKIIPEDQTVPIQEGTQT